MTRVTNAVLLARVEALETSLAGEVAERRGLEKALADSVEQQTATSEILREISSSPTNTRSVFNAIA